MLTRQDVERLRNLLRRRLGQLEARLQEGGNDGFASATELEREVKAITALMKALQSVDEMARAYPDIQDMGQDDDEGSDAAFRARLAQQLETLCAKTGRPRRGGGA